MSATKGESKNSEGKKEKMNWHSCLAPFLKVRWPQDDPNTPFIIQREVNVGDEPFRLDFVFTKKDPGLYTQDPILASFKEHQIIEYKGPDDSLNIHTFEKGLGYAAMYSHDVNAGIFDGKVGVTFFRRANPRDLLKVLQEKGFSCKRTANGVYDIALAQWFSAQIVVTQEISDSNWGFLRLLANNLNKADYDVFSSYSNGLREDQKEKVAYWVNRCIDENSEFVKTYGIEGVIEMFSDYVNARYKAREDSLIRQILNLILDTAKSNDQSFDDALAKASITDDVKAEVRNLYAAGVR